MKDPLIHPKTFEEWNELFLTACLSGDFKVIQMICHLEFKTIANIHTECEEGFRLACDNGHLEIVKFLTTSPELLAAGHTFANILNSM